MPLATMASVDNRVCLICSGPPLATAPAHQMPQFECDDMTCQAMKNYICCLECTAELLRNIRFIRCLCGAHSARLSIDIPVIYAVFVRARRNDQPATPAANMVAASPPAPTTRCRFNRSCMRAPAISHQGRELSLCEYHRQRSAGYQRRSRQRRSHQFYE